MTSVGRAQDWFYACLARRGGKGRGGAVRGGGGSPYENACRSHRLLTSNRFSAWGQGRRGGGGGTCASMRRSLGRGFRVFAGRMGAGGGRAHVSHASPSGAPPPDIKGAELCSTETIAGYPLESIFVFQLILSFKGEVVVSFCRGGSDWSVSWGVCRL